eukprot:Gb_38010 [translate_table: standard]
MGAAPSDEVVAIRLGQNQGDPSVITVNCLDKIGLSCDLARVIFESGLSVVRGDLSTDGKWCYLIFWVLPRTGSPRPIRWAILKKNLLSACPPNPAHLFYVINPEPKPKKVYLLQLCSLDRAGLLNDVSQVLWELELTIHKVKVSTTPEGKVMDLFFITDNRDLLPTKKRQDDVCDRLKSVLGESATCELSIAPAESGSLECTPIPVLPPSVAEDLFNSEALELETDSRSLGPNGAFINKFSVTVDNSLSPAHTLLQISCKDHKGLLYDVLRTLKDYNIQISYGRLSTNPKEICEVDLFVLQADGRKIIDPQKQNSLCSRLEMEILHPVRVMVVDRGPDTELLVASPIELSGRGRPRVLYDATLVLKMLDICIFTADIGRHVIGDRQWEVYRFLLIDRPDLSLGSSRTRCQIRERVENMLFG